MELFADFLAGSVEVGGGGEDFGWLKDFFLGEGRVCGEVRGAGAETSEPIVAVPTSKLPAPSFN